MWQKRKCGVKYGCLTISHSTVREMGGPLSPWSPRGAAGTYPLAQTPQGYPAVRPELQNPFFAIPCWVLPQNPPSSVSPALWGRDLGCRAFPRAPHSCPKQQSKPQFGVSLAGGPLPLAFAACRWRGGFSGGFRRVFRGALRLQRRPKGLGVVLGWGCCHLGAEAARCSPGPSPVPQREHAGKGLERCWTSACPKSDPLGTSPNPALSPCPTDKPPPRQAEPADVPGAAPRRGEEMLRPGDA